MAAIIMHAMIEPGTGDRPALQPNAAIGPAVRAIAGNILAKARIAVIDPERTDGATVHSFRRATKQWRALMRLLAPHWVRQCLLLTDYPKVTASKQPLK
jgi:hypothetical protein